MSQAGLRLARRLALGALVTLPAGAAAEEAASPRADLERFEWALDRAVRKVSRPSAAPILGGADACRGYHINGYGALFVLTPRSLPVRPRTALESPPQPAVVAPPPALRGRLEKLEAERRRKARMPSDKETADDLLALEAQVAALQRAAETARAEAEAALEETTRELHRRLLSSTLGTPMPLPPGAPGTPASAEKTPPPPTPPWRFWSESEEPEEARTPERVVEDVRSAVTEVLETQGPPLRLAGDEFVVVVVDFLPRSAFATRTRPARTLVVRVRKRELDARASGQLAAEDLRKRIEYSEY